MKDIVTKIEEGINSNMGFTFDEKEILKSNDENELLDAFEEVCARNAALKKVPEQNNKLKEAIRKRIQELK